MKSFKLTQKMFGWLRIRPLNDDASLREKIIDIICFGAIISNPFIFIISSIIFIFRHPDEFNACLYASFQVIGLAAVLYSITHAYLRRHQISEIFSMFQRIYDERE